MTQLVRSRAKDTVQTAHCALCTEHCQALSADNKLFSFGLKISSDTFNFELKEPVRGSCSQKKKSPSQLRREMRRREERKRAATMHNGASNEIKEIEG